ncbi:MAG: hypothetical protein OQK48_07755 [Sulfurimonas sp.]|uniref:hypothetical protein n=1 Tax=Sulfurimonas sp. TaxID=2022749 RepID=UPI0026395F97|nr:hypothetical protein [Sulfurimonas sp.]MCW8895140.1 hypothetical protein [Sulfurimonas sp.]MCW8954827.1 hypothetical protein [Sulfurimonas sp.]MCW9068284.1 hypothetical protein [Sulfurimonas sp.]
MIGINSYNSSISTALNTSQQNYNRSSETKNSETKRVSEAQDFYDIANSYDVKNISVGETAALSKELYNKEEITIKEHVMLSSDDRSSQADKNGNYNLIEEFKTRMELNKKLSEEQSLKNNKEILEILTKLDTLKSRQPLDIKI